MTLGVLLLSVIPAKAGIHLCHSEHQDGLLSKRSAGALTPLLGYACPEQSGWIPA